MVRAYPKPVLAMLGWSCSQIHSIRACRRSQRKASMGECTSTLGEGVGVRVGVGVGVRVGVGVGVSTTREHTALSWRTDMPCRLAGSEAALMPEARLVPPG